MKKNELTPKEKMVGRLLIAGVSIQEISKELNISVRTVEYYQKRIKLKLCSRNTYETGYKIGLLLKSKRAINLCFLI